jgi:hypothetical protein
MKRAKKGMIMLVPAVAAHMTRDMAAGRAGTGWTFKEDGGHSCQDFRAGIVWCLHCERTYRRGECRVIDGIDWCPYPGCDGSVMMDQWPWSHVRAENPSYPVIPDPGITYPLYPTKKV